MTEISPKPPRAPLPTSHKWIIGVTGGVTLLALLALVIDPDITPNKSSGKRADALYEARRLCRNVGALSDGGRTLYLDGQGRSAGSGRYDTSDVACILDQLGAPDHVTRHIEQTSALDGRQTERWSAYEAAWTYHPDRGLDITVRVVD